jgi:hypothetical protein
MLCTDLILRAAPGSDPSLSIVVCWSGDPAEGERVMAPLRTLARTAQGTIGPAPYVRLQSMFDGSFPDGRKYYQKSGLLSVLNEPLTETLIDLFATPRTQPLTMQLQGMGGAAGRVAPNATAFVHRDALWDMAIITNWENAAESDAHIAAMRAVWARLEPFSKGFYVNSRYEDDVKAFRENYGDNYPRLVQLKNRYDPMNLFRLNANVIPG